MFPSLYSQPTEPPSYNEAINSNDSSHSLHNTNIPRGQSGNRNNTSYSHGQSGNQNTASYPHGQSSNRNNTSYPHSQSGYQSSTNYSHGQSGKQNNTNYPHSQSGYQNNTNHSQSQPGYQSSTNYPHGQSSNRNNTDYSHGQSASQMHNASSDERTTSFEKFVRRYESRSLFLFEKSYLPCDYHCLCLVNKTFADKLRTLNGCEIVFICDDSGSMNTELGKLFISFNCLSF